MNYLEAVLQVVDEALGLSGRSSGWTRETELLGAVPELDSMAVVTLLTALAERFNIPLEDDAIDGTVFASVGTLVDFVVEQLKTGV